MKRMFVFFKRNLTEMIREPFIYVFCVLFPGVLLLLFALIGHYVQGEVLSFSLKSLLPGILSFSYSFVLLLLALQVSKDRKSALLRRLYVSPMKTSEFVFGYFFVGLLIGLFQSVFALLLGYLISLVTKAEYLSFVQCLFLILENLPLLVFHLFCGILIGSLFSDKAAPGISSVLISLGGVLSGCWMPLETMGNLENICMVFPFYPTVYLGRIITGASRMVSSSPVYVFDLRGKLCLIPYLVYPVLFCVLSFVGFSYQKNEK